ncbi:hypothetical protein FDX11_01665 [Citrobacter sp. wls714]|nr:hypothetical protein FDX11_01665 [Citrobacter sp. wls714]
MLMTGVRRWKHKSQSTASCRHGRVLFLSGAGEKICASNELRFIYGRWRMPETSAVACLKRRSSITTATNGPWFLFANESRIRLCHKMACVLRWMWTD